MQLSFLLYFLISFISWRYIWNGQAILHISNHVPFPIRIITQFTFEILKGRCDRASSIKWYFVFYYFTRFTFPFNEKNVCWVMREQLVHKAAWNTAQEGLVSVSTAGVKCAQWLAFSRCRLSPGVDESTASPLWATCGRPWAWWQGGLGSIITRKSYLMTDSHPFFQLPPSALMLYLRCQNQAPPKKVNLKEF